MRISILLLMAISIFYCRISYAQDTVKIKSLESAIDLSLKRCRKEIADDKALIYCIIETQLEKKNINFTKNDFIVENSINGKSLDNKTSKFVLKYLVYVTSQHTFITVIKWKIKKKSNMEIEYTDLMTRYYYELE